MIHGAHKDFKFGKYARSYLGIFAYRFNLVELLSNLLRHAAHTSPTRERQIRGTAEVHD